MLIEILGNSSSLLVIVLIGLSIYFGIQAKTKKVKWGQFIWIIINEANQQLTLQKNISLELTYLRIWFLTSSRLWQLLRAKLDIGIQVKSTYKETITGTNIDNGKKS